MDAVCAFVFVKGKSWRRGQGRLVGSVGKFATGCGQGGGTAGGSRAGQGRRQIERRFRGSRKGSIPALCRPPAVEGLKAGSQSHGETDEGGIGATPGLVGVKGRVGIAVAQETHVVVEVGEVIVGRVGPVYTVNHV